MKRKNLTGKNIGKRRKKIEMSSETHGKITCDSKTSEI